MTRERDGGNILYASPAGWLELASLCGAALRLMLDCSPDTNELTATTTYSSMDTGHGTRDTEMKYSWRFCAFLFSFLSFFSVVGR